MLSDIKPNFTKVKCPICMKKKKKIQKVTIQEHGLSFKLIIQSSKLTKLSPKPTSKKSWCYINVEFEFRRKKAWSCQKNDVNFS